MRKIYYDQEILTWQREVFYVPDDMSDEEIVENIQNHELEAASVEYLDECSEMPESGRIEIFDDKNNMLYSK